MYTTFFLIAALVFAVTGWGGDSPTSKVLCTLFTVLYLISLVFDVCDKRERDLEDEEDEEDFRAHVHYFD